MRMETRKRKTTASRKPSYDNRKQYNGKQYTGMQVGRSHHWDYDPGDWKETKITPDLWEISYAVTKRRRGKAPEYSGVPVGTGYHWYILAHQYVEKLNANDYTTDMRGFKFKIAHHRAGAPGWNVKGGTQRKRLIKFLKDMIIQLEQPSIPLKFTWQGVLYKGEAQPVMATCEAGVCREAEVMLNDQYWGVIKRLSKGWKIDRVEDGLSSAVGEQIDAAMTSNTK